MTGRMCAVILSEVEGWKCGCHLDALERGEAVADTIFMQVADATLLFGTSGRSSQRFGFK